MAHSTQVLVVGAGPVGLMAALELQASGIDVTVVDQKAPDDAKSHAVILHPRVLRALVDRGLDDTLVWNGCSLKYVVVFSEREKRATVALPPASEVSEGGLTLPQGVLQRAEERVLQELGVVVRYRRQVVALEQSGTAVTARFKGPGDELESLAADFVVGADGRDSTVRKLLGIERVERRPPVTYVFFDVPKDSRSGSQVELALAEGFSDARIPLHGGMMRYAFQLERTLAQAPGVQLLRELVAARMPWHRSELQGVEWSAVGTFEHASAERYGSNRIWLAGDAAHLTGPLGVQSLNVGIWEARELARTIAACVRGAPADLLRSRYEAGRLAEWRRLLAREPGTPFGEKAPAWVRRHLPQLVSSLPASGDDLDDLLDQLGVSLL